MCYEHIDLVEKMVHFYNLAPTLPRGVEKSPRGPAGGQEAKKNVKERKKKEERAPKKDK
jgi:hypothetical protein